MSHFLWFGYLLLKSWFDWKGTHCKGYYEKWWNLSDGAWSKQMHSFDSRLARGQKAQVCEAMGIYHCKLAVDRRLSEKRLRTVTLSWQVQSWKLRRDHVRSKFIIRVWSVVLTLYFKGVSQMSGIVEETVFNETAETKNAKRKSTDKV